jgi:predicted AlkP superfamily phosphohydrolase/phosphomutase
MGKTAEAALPRRILIIGLDGATLDLVQPWVEQGHLPHLARFFAEGAVGPMRSVPTQNSAAAWSSMVTGCNPGKHGIYWFTMDKPGSYDQVYINASHRAGRTMFRLLSDGGKSVGAVNVPISYPAEEINGFMIAGMDAPGVDAASFTHPPQLYTELHATLGDYTIEPDIPTLFKTGRIDDAVRSLHDTISQRHAYVRYLMETRPWDLLMAVFRSTDPAHHFFWKYLRPEGFKVPRSDIQRYSGVILDVYRQLDDIIADLMSVAGDQTTVFLASDHGATAADGRRGVMPYWLEHLGFMRRLAPSGSQAQLRRLVGEAVGGAYRQLDKRLGRDLKLRLAARFPYLRRHAEARVRYHQVDWSHTRAYNDGRRPDILINLRGRQPLGIVEPGAEYDALRDEIIRALTEPRDPQTGEPYVDAVYRREEVYSGPYVERAPDLVIDWNRNSNINNLILGTRRIADLQRDMIRRNPQRAVLSGAHDLYGLIAVKGPGIMPGARIEGASLVDVAPTVLYLLGQALPAEMDGHVLRGIIHPDVLESYPVHIVTEGEDSAHPGSDYNDEEARVLGERLRGLGYVE